MSAIKPRSPAGWWVDAALLAGFVALTVALASGVLLNLDLGVRDWCDAHRPAVAYWTARGLNYLGQGGWLLTPLALALALALALRVRSARPLLVVVAAFALTYLTVGPLKLLFQRGYPHNFELPDAVELFSDPAGGTAYPSGHVVNSIVWYGVIALLLRAYARGRVGPAPLRAIRIVPPAIVFLTTTYLGFHWLTDSVAGLLLGVLLDRLLRRVPWDDVPLPDRLGDWRRPALFTRDQ